MDKEKDPSDERSGEIIEDACASCEDGACSWHNTPAQSEGDKGGV